MAIFKLRSPFVKKSNTPLINNGSTQQLPELFNGSYFYPINLTENQNDPALLKMYNDLPEISAPVNYIADKSSEIPIVHEVLRGDKWEDVENSPILDILDNPNQFSNQSLFRKQFIINYIVFGNAYINAVESVGFNRPGELFVLPSNKIEVKLKNVSGDYRLNEILGYTMTFDGKSIFIPKDQVEHVRQASLADDNYYKGRSKLMSAILTSDSLRYNYEARVSIYKARGAMVVISPKGETVVLQEEQQKAILDKWNEKFGVRTGQSPAMVGSAPIDVTNVSPDIKGLMLNENKLQDYQTVCSVLSFPSVLLNDNKSSTYNNMNTALKSFYENSSMPINTTFTQSLMNIYGLNGQTERLRADYSNVSALQDDEKVKVDINSTMWNDNQITQNEYRSSMGKPEVPNGEKTKSEIEQERNSQDQGGETGQNEGGN